MIGGSLQIFIPFSWTENLVFFSLSFSEEMLSKVDSLRKSNKEIERARRGVSPGLCPAREGGNYANMREGGNYDDTRGMEVANTQYMREIGNYDARGS